MEDKNTSIFKKPVAGNDSKPHIGIFGRCNTGKSSLLNFLTETSSSIVSPQGGTTTDIVKKSYEILDFAPVIFIDTAGIDDTSELAGERIAKTENVFSLVDMGIIVYQTWGSFERDIAAKLEHRKIPFIAVNNIFVTSPPDSEEPVGGALVFKTNLLNAGEKVRNDILDGIKHTLPENSHKRPSMFKGMVQPEDIILLVCPIDSEAPSGRMILPQVQAIRDLLDMNAIPLVIQPEQIKAVIEKNINFKLVVTDSQVYKEVRTVIGSDKDVTTFSILLAASKGDIDIYNRGLKYIDKLKDGDRILISESCSHQVSCEDIGRVKIPGWLKSYSGKNLDFTFLAGNSPLPGDISSYAMMVQCGGCMVTPTQLRNRIREADSAGVPVVNYGMLICKIRP